MSAVAATLDKDLYSTLTDEERAAIEDHEYTPDELASLKRIAGDGDTPGATETDDDGDDADEVLDANGNPVAAATEVKAPAATSPAAADTGIPVSGAVVATAPQQAAPAYVAKLPENFQEQVDALATKTNELRTKFKAGEIDLDQFDADNAALQSERDNLNLLRTKAEISQDMTAQGAAQAWANTVNGFFSSVKQSGGFDYQTDEARRSDLDMFVKALANDEKTSDKPMDWFLSEAHKRVQALHGVAPATPKVDTPKDPLAEAREKRKPNLSATPATLAHVPGGDGPGDVAGEFAHLDALEGDALESAIARMTPAQREKFSRGE